MQIPRVNAIFTVTTPGLWTSMDEEILSEKMKFTGTRSLERRESRICGLFSFKRTKDFDRFFST